MQPVTRGKINRVFWAAGVNLTPSLPKDVFKSFRGRLYCKTQTSFDLLKSQLTASGFTIHEHEGGGFSAWRGKYDDRHMHQSYSVTNASKWGLPLQSSPDLARKVLGAVGEGADIDYWIGSSAENRPYFSIEKQRAMREFVRNFTTLDLMSWDRMMMVTPTSPVKMIRAIGAFCHPDTVVSSGGSPFHGFLLVANALTHQPISEDLLQLAADGWKKRAL